jgi:hypothetical protein
VLTRSCYRMLTTHTRQPDRATTPTTAARNPGVQLPRCTACISWADELERDRRGGGAHTALSLRGHACSGYAVCVYAGLNRVSTLGRAR